MYQSYFFIPANISNNISNNIRNISGAHFYPLGSFGAAGQKQTKRKFSPEEDERLAQIVGELGESNWKRIAERLGSRNFRQCRERWINYLSPKVCRDPWTRDEDELLLSLFAALGSQWSAIAKSFRNRTDVNIKNRWAVLNKSAGKSCHFEEAAASPSAETEDFHVTGRNLSEKVVASPEKVVASTKKVIESPEKMNDTEKVGQIIADGYFDFTEFNNQNNNDDYEMLMTNNMLFDTITGEELFSF